MIDTLILIMFFLTGAALTWLYKKPRKVKPRKVKDETGFTHNKPPRYIIFDHNPNMRSYAYTEKTYNKNKTVKYTFPELNGMHSTSIVIPNEINTVLKGVSSRGYDILKQLEAGPKSGLTSTQLKNLIWPGGTAGGYVSNYLRKLEPDFLTLKRSRKTGGISRNSKIKLKDNPATRYVLSLKKHD